MRILLAAAASALALTACSSGDDGQNDQDTDPVGSTIAACEQYLEDYAGDSSQLTEDKVREQAEQAQDDTVRGALNEAAELLPGPTTQDRTRALLRGQVVCNQFVQQNSSGG